jgi:hypothetical protein
MALPFSSSGTAPKGLNNQIKDYWETGKYRLQTSLVSWEQDLDRMSGSKGDEKLHISYQVPEMQDSLITLTMKADDLRFITNVAPGRIIVGTITDFEALGGNPGIMVVRIVNEGCIAAKFSVGANCNSAIVKMPTFERSVAPGNVWSVSYDVHTTSDASAENWCNMVLYDATGQLTDELNSTFATNSTCICIGSCDCKCDPGLTDIVRCVSKESTPIESTGAVNKFCYRQQRLIEACLEPSHFWDDY